MPRKKPRIDVAHEEFDRLIDRFEQLTQTVLELRQNYDIQFTRIVQLQAEIDELHRAHAPTT